ncbi:TonB-dependent receptor [Desulfonatronospira sp.]|uniref:TonB-dependent receptor plug domain-containing protein n=1 Tax=Desulfonatronospira sp. TaxID=1962951 RepID=UPI0025B92178|nr:TonB-dependent receptor [Desulfonatronospira sp.]
MPKSINILIMTFLMIWWAPYASWAGADDGTMLLFVGEDIELLSIASRREETPARAPAVAQLITREDFQARGQRTLSSLLKSSPGFHVARKEGRYKPYLRGIPDSALFLYDTVPLGSEISKSLQPIGHELPLFAVKQVEIVRGPSSVLWGPDAFAGVVNVVPLSGKDFQGADAGILYGSPGCQREAHLKLGHDAGAWDGFLALSARQGEEDDRRANIVSFFDYNGSRPVPPEMRTGSKNSGDAHYLDSYARLNLGRNISLSGRLSNSYRPYTVENHVGDQRWIESRSLTSGFFKLDANHELNLETKLRLSGYFSGLNHEHEIIDKELTQKDRTYYSEALLDRSLFGARGLLTAGLSYKHKEIRDAPVWDGYIPVFVVPENRDFRPVLTTTDFSNHVWSIFGQYSHKLGDFDLMFGLRQDFHREYQDNMSHSAALVWSPLQEWTLKLLYGTSYRTPFARQLIEEDKPDMEKSENYSLQVIWDPGRSFFLSGTFFYNRISSHVTEDLGLASDPNNQDIFGLELEAFYSPMPGLDLESNLTLLENKGSNDLFRDTVIEIRPDGTFADVSQIYRPPFDTGPKSMFNFMARWQASNNISVHGRLEYFSSRRLIFARADEFERAPGVWLLHAGADFEDFFIQGMDLSLNLRNLTNKRYETPGTFRMIRDRGISGEVMLRYNF